VLSQEYGAPVNPLRFRPNIVVDGPEASAFEEIEWPGATFSAGEAVFEALHPCERCVLTTIDPETLVMDPAFLRLVVQKHGGRFGVYCRVVRAGTVTIGDEWVRRTAQDSASAPAREGVSL